MAWQLQRHHTDPASRQRTSLRGTWRDSAMAAPEQQLLGRATSGQLSVVGPFQRCDGAPEERLSTTRRHGNARL